MADVRGGINRSTGVGLWGLVVVITLTAAWGGGAASSAHEVANSVPAVLATPRSTPHSETATTTVATPRRATAQKTPVAAQVFPPTRLRIPAIGVDAAVQEMSALPSGQLGVPSNWTDVAWYRYGPVPGQPGDAVIDGHLDSYTAPAVFWRLSKLRPGDGISVQLANATTVTFRVSGQQEIPYLSRSLGSIFAMTGPPTLTLITCGGQWLAAERVYADRLIVHAVLVAPPAAPATA
jgi:sortase (surface protein transpeptidase)